MTRLVLAVLPSNQDGNRSSALGNESEMEHIALLADAVLIAASHYSAITAKIITASPQSQDWPHDSLSGLIAQQKAAAAWIATNQQPGDLSVALNLHSDSGNYRHCGYYYDGPSTVSQWLGRALAESVQGWFGNRIVTSDYSAYIFARELHFTACPVLLEMGAHTIPLDVAALRDHGNEIARTLLGTMAGFFGLGATPPLNLAELRQYGEWAIARCGNGEDPRSRAAFVTHLKALGCDTNDLSRWGWPV